METEEPEGPQCPTVLLSQAQHGGRCMSAQALNSLNDLRQKNLLCDATIRLEDGGVFHVHRAILSSCSTYFRYPSLHVFQFFYPYKINIFPECFQKRIREKPTEWKAIVLHPFCR